jgi:single-strand DNA-binding protein
VGRQAQLLRRHRLGAQGETVARYNTKGSALAIDGRLEWREWDTDAGAKRQAVEIIADTIQFLGSSNGAAAAADDAAEADVPGFLRS